MKEYIVLSTDEGTRAIDGSYIFRLLRPLKGVKSLRVVYAGLPKTGKFLTTDLNLRVQGGMGLNTSQRATMIEKNENNDASFNFLGRLHFQDLTTGSFVQNVVDEALKWGTIPQFIFENNNPEYMKYHFKPVLPILNQIRFRFDEFGSTAGFSPTIHAFSLGVGNVDLKEIESPDDPLYKVRDIMDKNTNTSMTKSDALLNIPAEQTTVEYLLTEYNENFMYAVITKEVYMAHLYTFMSSDDPLWWAGDDTYTPAMQSPFSGNARPISNILTNDDAVKNHLTTYIRSVLDYVKYKTPKKLCNVMDYKSYSTDSNGVYATPLLFTSNKLQDESVKFLTDMTIFKGTIFKRGWNVHSDFPNNFNDTWIPRTPDRSNPVKYNDIDAFAAYAFHFFYRKINGFTGSMSAHIDDNHAIELMNSPTRCIFVPEVHIQEILNTFNSVAAKYLFLSVLLKLGRLRVKYTEVKNTVKLERYEYFTVQNVYLPDDYQYPSLFYEQYSGLFLLESTQIPELQRSNTFCVAVELNREMLPKNTIDGETIITEVELTLADSFYTFRGAETGNERFNIDSFINMAFPAALTVEADIEEQSCFLGLC